MLPFIALRCSLFAIPGLAFIFIPFRRLLIVGLGFLDALTLPAFFPMHTLLLLVLSTLGLHFLVAFLLLVFDWFAIGAQALLIGREQDKLRVVFECAVAEEQCT